MKEIKTEDYKVVDTVKLSEKDTYEDFGASKKKLKKELKDIRKDLGDFQDTLYAHGKYGVLVCLQGMDTAGKDSLIREVFKDFNVRGVVVHSFKVPSTLEKSTITCGGTISICPKEENFLSLTVHTTKMYW